MDLFDLVAKISLETSEYKKGLEESSGQAKNFAQKIGGGLATASKIGAVAIGAVTTASMAAAGAITQNTGQVAAFGDNIDKMSQKMGISAQAYQEWDAIMQHSGTSIDALKPSMKTLASAAEKNSDAFQKLGISQQEVASLNQEELFARTISALQGMEEGTERTYLTSQLLGRGATELGALLNTSAEDTEKMRQRVHELGGVMSDEAVKAAAAYQDSLQDMNTSIDGIKRNIFSGFLPSITMAMDGLTNLFSGDTEAGIAQLSDGVSKGIENLQKIMPRVFEIGGGIAKGLAQAIEDNLPAIVSAGTNAIAQLITGAVEHLPDVIKVGGDIIKSVVSGFADSAPALMDAGLEVINTIADGLAQGIPEFLSNALPMLVEFSGTLREKAGVLIDAGLNLLENLAQGIADSLPVLIENIPTIVENIANIINDNAPKIIETGFKIIITLIKGIIQAIPTLIANIPKIISAIVAVWSAFNWMNLGKNLITAIGNGIKSLAGSIPNTISEIIQNVISFFSGIDWPSVGYNIILGIVNGLTSAGGILWNAAVNVAKLAFKGITDFFGIHSPSKKGMWIGEMIDKGIAKGFDDNIPSDSMVDSMQGIMDRMQSIKVPEFSPSLPDFSIRNPAIQTIANAPNNGYNSSEIFTVPRENQRENPRNLTVILEIGKEQFGKLVYQLGTEEMQRVGVKLAGGVV